MRSMVTRIGPRQPRRNFLAKWRESKGLTQEELANRLETYKGQISNWENGRRDMTFNVQAGLAEALGIEPEDLFRDPDRPSPSELLRDDTIRVVAELLKDQDGEMKRKALDMVKILVGRGAG